MHPLKQHREILDDFWKYFGTKGFKRYISKRDKETTIIGLRDVAGIVIQFRHQRTLKQRRDSFNRVKFRRHNLKYKKNCFACGDVGHVRHHIILLKNGGINSKRNLITLCNRCHSEIHPWLK